MKISDSDSVDRQCIADLVTQIALMFGQLRQLKTTAPPRPRDERVMRPAPGPRAPVNICALSLDIELTEVVWDIATDIRNNLVDTAYIPLPRDAGICLTYIRSNAAKAAELPHAVDIVDSLEVVRSDLARVVRPERPVQRVERRRPVKEALAVLYGMGVDIPRGSLWSWEQRGYITTTRTPEGTKLYLVSELLQAWKQVKGNTP